MESLSPSQPPVATCGWRTVRAMALYILAVLLTAGNVLVQGQSVNVALNKRVSARISCGSRGTEPYLNFQDAAKQPSQRTVLRCDNSTFPSSNLVDGKVDTKWQSTSRMAIYSSGIFSSSPYTSLEAVIEVDLSQEFSAEKLMVRFEDALRPDWMAVSKSLDGSVYVPWAYKVTLASNCTVVKVVPTSNLDTVCSTYTEPDPQSFQTITFDFTQIPQQFREWKRIRYLRIEFFSMPISRMFLAAGNLFQHYAVAEVEVIAQCVCNGQQTGCELNNVTGQFACVCGGNTLGSFCEMCQSFYNQKPFRYGVPCEACNCFSHATACVFDQAVADAGGSLNAAGVREGGGRCTSCQHNTAGVNCELCLPLFYRPVGVSQTAETACQPCNCSTTGSTVNPASNIQADCLMNNDKPASDGKLPGDCYCKANVQGSKCNSCKPGFYNLLADNVDGCQACGCNAAGTVGGSQMCTPDTLGQCPCKANTQGRTCDTCKDNFYNLDPNNPSGCSPCDCDPGGSLSRLCDKVTGQCTCRPNVEGRQCNRTKAGYFYPTLHWVSGEVEAVSGTPWSSQQPGFLGPGYAILRAEAEVQVPLMVPGGTNLGGQFVGLLRYSTQNSTPSAVSVRVFTADPSTALTIQLPACVGTWCTSASTSARNFTFTPGPQYLVVKAISSVLLDRVVALPVEYLSPQTVLGNTSTFAATCDVITNDMKLGSPSEALCKQGVFSLTMQHLNGPRQCACHPQGSSSSCQEYGGQCVCKDGVTGRQCDYCSPGHYDLTATGCRSCACAGNMLCDQVTGQCTCPPNVFGRQCDQCTIYHYGWDPVLGCTPCNCNSQGSSSQQCNQTSGVCVCKEGVQGDKCDTCQDGYRGFGQAAQGGLTSGCIPCGCSTVGSTGSVCNKTSGQCPCKANTQGLLCDQCKSGSFNFGETNPKGCLDCICMGVVSVCQATATIRHQKKASMLSGSGTGLLSVVTQAGQGSGVNATLNRGRLEAVIPGGTTLYWTTPADLKGDLVSLYGSSIDLTVRYEHSGAAGTASTPRAVLTGKGGTVLVQTLPAVQPSRDTVLTVQLREALWRVDGSGANISRGQFLKALTSVQSILLPASFSSTAHTSSVILLEYSQAGNVGSLAPSVEQCACPSQYTGPSCQRCATGFKRANVSSHEYLGVCVPCECNSHASTCDPDTGECLDCQHNTAGPNCEVCKVGYYGDATRGLPSDCSMCPCYTPRVANATCQSVNGTVQCSFCNPGYVGDLCDSCDAFYYGNPKVVGTGTCQRCNCNGNSAQCDSVTGECLNCTGNTEGFNCERCKAGFFGNASAQACQECGCDMRGSNDSVCDRFTGQCPCMPGVGNRTCAGCLYGYYGYSDNSTLGCVSCDCVAAGSVDAQCGANDGVCSCRPNTNGTKCSTCFPGFFGLPDRSCEACNCNTTGTVTTAGVCNVTSGQCDCKPGVTGRQCDQCMALYTNFSDTGCTACGQCQFSLGNDTASLTRVWEGYWGTADVVSGLGRQDAELQQVQAELDRRLSSLGLSGSSLASLNTVTANLSSTQAAVSVAVADMQSQVRSVQAESSSLRNRTGEEQKRLEGLQNDSEDLLATATNTDQATQTQLSALRQNNATAAQLLTQDAVTDAGGLSYQAELTTAQAELDNIRADTAVLNMEQKVQQQRAAIQSLQSVSAGIQADMANLSRTVQTYEQHLAALEAQEATILADQSAAKADKTATEANMATTLDVLNRTELILAELASSQQAAQAKMADHYAVYNGTAQGHIPEGVVLTNGVANWVNGKSMLEARIAAMETQISRDGPTIQAAEIFAQDSANKAQQINETFQAVQGRGSGAVAAIQNFEQVVAKLDSAVQMAVQANTTVQEARRTLATITVLNLEASANQSRNDSIAVLASLNALNYNPQVLASQVESANASLQQAKEQWRSALAVVTQMSSAAQQLSTLAANTAVDTQLNTASIAADEAATEAQTVINTNAVQNATLNLRQSEASTKMQEAAETVRKINEVSTNLESFKNRVNNLRRQIDFISNHRAENNNKKTSIETTISSVEQKLLEVESRLSQLTQPVHFNGSTSVAFTDPGRGVGQTYHEVGLEFRSDPGKTDAVLFFAEDPASGAELSVRLAGGKVTFAFNTNVDPVLLTNPASICSNCWARVLASRYGNIGHLSVTLLSTGGRATVSGRGQTSVNQITVQSSLYFGSLPRTYQQSKVPATQFRGCMRSVTYGGEGLNLWGRAVEQGQQPQCCRRPSLPASPALDPGLAFPGFGHLELPAGWLDFGAASLALSLQFRTFSPTATLLLVATEDGAASYALSLRNGFVVLRYGSSGTFYEIQSREKYNTGVWFKLTAQHDASQLNMTVAPVVSTGGDATDVGAKAAGAVNLSPLSNRTVILGAAAYPSSTGYAPGLNNFAGCMKELQYGSSASNLVTRPLTSGIVSSSKVSTTGCPKEVLSGVTLTTQQSYAELNTQQRLVKLQTLQFSLVTSQPQGVLLLVKDPLQSTRDLYLALFHGNLVLRHRQSSSHLLTSQGLYLADGQAHSIVLDFTQSRAVMNVDGRSISEDSPTLLQDSLQFSADSTLLLGGQPNALPSDPALPTSKAAVAGLRLLLINGVALDIFSPGILRGQSDISLSGIPTPSATTPAPPFTTLSPPVTTPAAVCAAVPVATYQERSAGIFLEGNEGYFSKTLTAAQQTRLLNSFVLSITFAAYRGNGVILAAADNPSSVQRWLVIYLQNGYINVNVRAILTDGSSLNIKLRSALTYNLGRKFKVDILRINSFVALVENVRKDYVNDGNPQQVANFSMGSDLYVGGVNPAQLTLPADASPLTGDKQWFAGAVYEIKIDQANSPSFLVDLQSPTTERYIKNIYTRAHYGISLSGVNSYIRLRDDFTVIGALNVRIGLRTTQKSANLLNMYASQTNHLVLELSSGQVRVVVANPSSGSQPFITVTSLGVNICDNNLHNITFSLSSTGISVQVDQLPNSSAPFPASFTAPVISGKTLYLGGYADTALVFPEPVSRTSLQGCISSLSLDSTVLDPAELVTSGQGTGYACPY